MMHINPNISVSYDNRYFVVYLKAQPRLVVTQSNFSRYFISGISWKRVLKEFGGWKLNNEIGVWFELIN